MARKRAAAKDFPIILRNYAVRPRPSDRYWRGWNALAAHREVARDRARDVDVMRPAECCNQCCNQGGLLESLLELCGDLLDPGIGAGFVLFRARRARNANGADDLVAGLDRDPAAERNRAGGIL